ncbi:MAG: efflux RND transporter periplasmic adaptor subunit [Rickettsiales bacterium]|nr:efflux RND transporter periplasmic adaptor subunit [Rickettsiales bacterium]
MRVKNNSKKLITAVFLVIVFLGSYFFWIKSNKDQKPIVATKTNPAATMPIAVPVTTTTITKQQVQLFNELPARVNAYKIAQIRPQVEGIIRKIKFVEGSFVKRGQQLYQIDPDTYQAAFESAKSSLKSAQAKRKRYKNLLAQDAISRQEFDDVNAALAQAKSDLSKARKNLDYTKVLAPISGYIGKSNFTEGALVTANQSEALTTITQLDPIYVDMEQPSKDAILNDNRKEIKVSITTQDPNYQNIGKLKFSEMFADESTDSVRLRAIFSNKDKKLIPGMFVNAKLHLPPFSAITVPQKATTRAANGDLTVFVVDEQNIAKVRTIKAEEIFGDSWIVNEGLQDGEIVIIEGFQKVSEGAKVNPTPN